MTTTRRTPKEARGYVLLVVLILLIVLTAAGVYGLQTVEGDLRASSAAVKHEVLAQAAEAGAAQRMAEIALADLDAGAAMSSESALENERDGRWADWPRADRDAPQFTNSSLTGFAMYMTRSRPLATVDTRPPPGRQIGSGGQTTVWQIESLATRSANVGGSTAMGEYQVSVGVSMWSRGGTSYNN